MTTPIMNENLRVNSLDPLVNPKDDKRLRVSSSGLTRGSRVHSLGLFGCNKFFYVPLVVAASLLSGCSSVRNTFGFDHYQPDEMQTDPNPRLAALTIPPNFQLRPPRPGIPNPNQLQADESAKEVLLGSSGSSNGSNGSKSSVKNISADTPASKAEVSVLDNASAQIGSQDDKNIREIVDSEVSTNKN